MCFMLQSSATACPPLSRTTPLGLPVVPDVYRMYSGSVDAMDTQSAGAAADSSSVQSRSRRGFHFGFRLRPLEDDAFFRLGPCELYGFIEQGLVRDDFLHFNAA